MGEGRNGRLSLTDQAYASLRRAIVTCVVEPGSRVSEAELQEISGQLRTPTRDATNRLANEGLVVVIPRHGYRIADVDVDSAAMLLDVYDPIARMAASLARSNIRTERMDDLHMLLKIRRAPKNRVDWLYDFSEKLESAMVDASGNVWLSQVIAQLNGHVHRLWSLAFREIAFKMLVERGFGVLIAALDSDEPALSARLFDEANQWIRQQILYAVDRHTQLTSQTEIPGGQ